MGAISRVVIQACSVVGCYWFLLHRNMTRQSRAGVNIHCGAAAAIGGWIGRTSGTRSDLLAATFPSCFGSNLLLFLPASTALPTLTLSLPQHLTTNTNTAATHCCFSPLATPQTFSSSTISSVSASRTHTLPKHPTVTLRLVTLRLSRQNWPTVAREHLETRAGCLRLALHCTATTTSSSIAHRPSPLPIQHNNQDREQPPPQRRRRLYPSLGTLVRYTTVPACCLVSSEA
jgi:hypothetical protein